MNKIELCLFISCKRLKSGLFLCMMLTKKLLNLFSMGAGGLKATICTFFYEYICFDITLMYKVEPTYLLDDEDNLEEVAAGYHQVHHDGGDGRVRFCE